MADDWGLPSLIVALCALVLTLSPNSLQFFASILRPLVVLAWPRSGRCESFEWAQIPDGPLHTCSDPVQACTHIGPGETFENVFTTFFNIKRGAFVRKPKQLRLNTKYIRTDAKTLKTFLSLVNTKVVFSAFNIGESPLSITFKDVDGIKTAYLTVKSGLPNVLNDYRLDVTKHEMELILQGYPPWYQHPLQISAGREVPHPILDETDLTRGGWVVAVGLSPTKPVTKHFWTSERKTELVMRAVKRIATCFRNLQQAFPAETVVAAAVRATERLSDMRVGGFGYSGSHVWHLFREEGFKFPRGSTKAYEGTKKLSDEQIVTALKVFNFYEALTPDEAAILEPELDTIVRGCLYGVWKVVFHVLVAGGREDRPYVVPQELEEDGFVYVRERWEASED